MEDKVVESRDVTVRNFTPKDLAIAELDAIAQKHGFEYHYDEKNNVGWIAGPNATISIPHRAGTLNGTSGSYTTEAYPDVDDEFGKLKKCLDEMSLTEVIIELKVSKRKLSELPNG